MNLKELTAIFMFSSHFLLPADVYPANGPAGHIKQAAFLPDQFTALHNYVNNEGLKGNVKWEEMFFRAVKLNESLIHFIVSSELDPVDPFEGQGRYGGHSLFDDDTTTAWVEGAEGQGTGEFIIFRAGENFPEKLIIHSGYQKSDRLFRMNSRPHTLIVSLYAGFYLEGDDTEIASRYRLRSITGTKVLELGDTMGAQTFNIPFDEDKLMQAKDTLESLFVEDFRKEIENLQALCPTCDPIPRFSFFIRLEIQDVYQGSQWADNCISEISYISSERVKKPQTGLAAEGERIPGEYEGVAEEGERISGEYEGLAAEGEGIAEPGRKTVHSGPLEGEILNVYEGAEPDAGIIYVDTECRKGIILVDKSGLEENELREEDENLDIVLMDVSPDMEWAQVDILFSRGDAGRVEEYSVLYNVRMLQRVDESILGVKYGMFGFVEDNGKIWLDTIDGFIDLDTVKDRMLKASDKGPGFQQLTE
ncbi:MAG: hypothetical protein V2I34_04320 [Bacteroidales bacterium]|nr:hypothetical protein [Bacteroidales bacterium]